MSEAVRSINTTVPARFDHLVTNELGYCWICGAIDTLEGHHVVPVAYGGEDGPIISLCGVCHGLIHTISYANVIFTSGLSEIEIAFEMWKRASNWEKPLSNNKLVAAQRGYYLAQIIWKARINVKDETSKPVKFSMTLPGHTSRMLKKLVKAKGLTNQEETIIAIIEEVYLREIGAIR